ncbi:unnamed protein product [Urochloa humidicola]
MWRSSAALLLPEFASSPPLPSTSFSKAVGSRMRQGYRSFNTASLSSIAGYRTSSRPNESFPLPSPLQSVDNLIFLMNGMTFNEEDKVKLKRAFYEKFQTLKSVDSLIFLMNEMTFNEEDKVKFKQIFYEKFQTLKNVHDLIFAMNEMAFTEEGKVKFKQAFYEKFRMLKTALELLNSCTIRTMDMLSGYVS